MAASKSLACFGGAIFRFATRRSALTLSSYRAVQVRHISETNVCRSLGFGHPFHYPKKMLREWIRPTETSAKIRLQASVANEEELKKIEQEQNEKREKSYKRLKTTNYVFTGMFGVMAVGVYYLWGSPKVDEDGNEIKDEFSEMILPLQYGYRAWNECLLFVESVCNPPSEQMLPDPDPHYQPPYTIAVELTNVLVKPDWDLDSGWRFKKRPGMEQFLSLVNKPYFELVLYTSETHMAVEAVLKHIENPRHFVYYLYRPATRYRNGVHLKDAKCLNRDPSKVIIIDFNKKAVKLNPENAVVLKEWDGNNEDTDLFDLTAFLHILAEEGIRDVREVLKLYNEYDDPMEVFRQSRKRVQEHAPRKEPSGMWSMLSRNK